MRKKAWTFRSNVLLVVIVTVVFTAITIQFPVQRETERAMLAAYDENAVNLMNTVVLHVESEYRSILFHESATLESRKTELRNIVTIAIHSIERCHKQQEDGQLTEAEAQRAAFDEIREMRYDNGVGYLWINDTGKPSPRMLMHPTEPELVGSFMDEARYYSAMGTNKNVLVAFADMAVEHGEGYVDYSARKPTEDGLSDLAPKISYVKLFEPWGWVIGTGVYIDDIEAEAQKRLDAVLTDLTRAFSKIRIAETGYLFIFNADGEMLVHPYMARGTAIDDSEMRTALLAKFVKAAKTPSVPFEYVWDKPGHRDEYRFRKRAYVTHFEPLDWYIGTSFYTEEMELPAKRLAHRTLFLSSLVLLAAVAFAVFVSKGLIKPLRELTLAAMAIEREGIHTAQIPISGTVETIELGTILNKMVSSIRKSEHDLQKANSYISSIVDSMPSVLVGVDATGKVTRWNFAAERATGIPATEAVGQPAPKVLPNMAADLERVREAIQSRKSLFVSERACQEDEGVRYEDITMYPLTANGFEGAVIRIDDVTERVEIEQEREDLVTALEAQNAELERFAYSVSHDLKTPLITINGYVGALAEDLAEGNMNRVEDALTRISNAADKMAVLLNDVLELSRIGRMANPPQDVSMQDLADEALQLVATQIKQKSIHVEVSPNLPVVYGDRLRLLEVVQNLVENAVKYMGDQSRPQIEIGSRRDGDETVFYVRDNGIGIEPRYHEKVFRLFDQLNQNAPGTGIGLALVKRIVEVHGGRVWVESEGLGQGSTFCFTIAAEGKSPEPERPTRSTAG